MIIGAHKLENLVNYSSSTSRSPKGVDTILMPGGTSSEAIRRGSKALASAPVAEFEALLTMLQKG